MLSQIWLKHSGLPGFEVIRVAIVGNVTTDLFTKALRACSIRYGAYLDIYEAPHNQMTQEALTHNSGLYKFQPEIVFFALDHRNLHLKCSSGDEVLAKQVVDEAFSLLIKCRNEINRHTSATCIIQSLVEPIENVFGSMSMVVPGTAHDMISEFNRRVFDHCRSTTDLVFDARFIANVIGLQTWHDPLAWNLGKLNFSQKLIPLYSDCLGRLIASTKIFSKKVLVVDSTTLSGAV